MNKPLISVIVPIYNAEKFLSQCIDSVLNQSYKNIEIILLNDGSKDKSGSICQEYAEKDTRIIYIEKNNSGVSDTRNMGLKQATGDYIFFLDSDDYLAPQCFEILYMASGEGQLAITGYYLDFTNKRNIYIPQQAYGSYTNIKEFLLDFHKYYATKFNFVWGKLYRTEIIRKHNITFREEIQLGEDQLFNQDYYRFCYQGITAVQHNGYYYRQHSESTLSKKFNPHMFQWNEYCFSSIRDYLKEFGCLTEINSQHLYKNILGNYNYSFYLIAISPQILLKEKDLLIRQYISTPIYQDSLFLASHQRADFRFFNWLLRHFYIKTYIIFENFKHNILHGNHKKN